MNAPSSVIFEASTKSETASIGAVIDPGKYKPGSRRPNDFDQFWKAERKALSALPLEIKTVLVNESGKGYN